MKRLSVIPLVLASLFVSMLHADDVTAVKKLDFGDYSSATLTTKGWNAYNAKNYDDAAAYAKECIDRYRTEAIAMQKELKEPMPASDKDAVLSKWALNDVGTCYFILGQSLEKLDKTDEAIKAYKQLLENVSFAQCWDPQGWFWKPADAAKKQVKMLEFAKLESEDDQ
ncbi:tetratricopeptide repeat protein [Aporhodopirellula aestuarii]|uniref:Tetratricopeptide repeat protein n=1 Tax=Aporhodopirellula aestuarii TaxID=2950107 RepID=A0ABT0U9S9_9BACT|nr:tetratricopeptide repeat protein [Aporhodopirellula aestuarii]MCM2373106.1 tetratricopeptide repeat protein [Aporhodopirellula aestuarii]